MKKYPKYKASGDWIREFPSDWGAIKYKFVANIETGSTPPKADNSNYEGGDILFVKPDELNGFTPIVDSKEKITKKALENSRLIKEFSLLTCAIGTIGKFGIAGTDCITNQQINSFTFKPKKINPKFGIYSFIASEDEQWKNSTTNVVAIINKTSQSRIYIPYPPLPEQHTIVQFLDHKTSQIDRFIANRQKQIELLKEQKAAIINKAVTKGINPNAKMKDSGIEWIGEVPEHWMIGKVRRVLNILTDFTANGSFADLAKNVKYLDTPDYSRLIRLTDLREDLKNEGIYVNKEAHKFLAKSELFGGEILMANVGAYAGLVCLVPKLDFVSTLGPNMFLLKFDDKRMSNQFAFTLLSSDCYYKLLMNKALSSAQPKLNKEDVKSIDFIFPPTHEEQDAIIEFIIEETSNVDTLISKYQKQIDLMQEYRTALVSQAVTGKIDVRDWKPKVKTSKK